MAENLDKKDEGENKSGAKKSSGLVLIIIIIILILTLVIGGIIVASLLSGNDEDVTMNSETPSGKMEGDGRGSQSNVRSKATKRIEDLEVGPMYPLDGFTINLLSDSGRRYLKATINLELMDKDTVEELEKKDPIIRDIIIRVLTSKTLEEIATAKGKEKLKDQLVNQINLRLRDGEIKNVYFVEFVIQ